MAFGRHGPANCRVIVTGIPPGQTYENVKGMFMLRVIKITPNFDLKIFLLKKQIYYPKK